MASNRDTLGERSDDARGWPIRESSSAGGGASSARNATSTIGDAIVFIERHYGDHLTLHSVAESVRMSKYHFSRLFHSTVGITFQAYLVSLRVRKAEEFLRQVPGRSLTRIATDVGFGSLRNMEKHFKAQTGLTPSQYRSRFRSRRQPFRGDGVDNIVRSESKILRSARNLLRALVSSEHNNQR